MLSLFGIKINISENLKKRFVISTYFWALIDSVGGFRQTCAGMSWSKVGELKP